jgi:sugar O-acyltransferase (sialic acid O-acetyltransferase NeuD family)
MSKVVLFGIGRGADVAYRFLSRDTDHEVSGFAVDRKFITKDTLYDLPVVAFEEVERRFPPDEYKMLILLGYQRMNTLRANKYTQAKSKGYTCISYANSNFYRSEELDMGENCFILDNQSISLDVKIGNNVVMWSSNHIGDLSVIGDHVWLASHVTIAAQVIVRSYCFLGIGATVANGVTLAQRTLVGANALIASNTSENSVHVVGETEPVDVDSAAFMRIMTARGKL